MSTPMQGAQIGANAVAKNKDLDAILNRLSSIEERLSITNGWLANVNNRLYGGGINDEASTPRPVSGILGDISFKLDDIDGVLAKLQDSAGRLTNL